MNLESENVGVQAITQEKFESYNNSTQNYLLYMLLKVLQAKLEEKEKENCCSCEEIRKIIQEEINKIPKPSNNNNNNNNPTPGPSGPVKNWESWDYIDFDPKPRNEQE